MKIVKKNQIIVLVIALMFISIGYLNFTSMNNDSNIETSIYTDDIIEYAGIGDAKLVSTIPENEENIQTTLETGIVENDENFMKEENSIAKNDTSNPDTNEEDTQYFIDSRLSREKMYSQMLETYQKILENKEISETQKSIAQTEIKNINDIKNKIMICENLIKIKNIQDVVIFVNDKSVSVIVKNDKLEQEQIAQIQNIIERELRNKYRKYSYK